VVVGKNEHGAFAFVCFGREGAPRDYGYNCAQAAVKDLHGKQIDPTHTWYVKPALNKQDREIEKKKEMIRYKNSKKRCNLYVKNFPPTTTSDQLKELFGKFGDIESIKIFPKEGEAVYAFVCFKNPEAASTAKAGLHQQPFNGKQLYINHYEIKEIRKA
jgi:polyadenylate-binding protein